MEKIIDYRDIPVHKRAEVLAKLDQIGFVPASGNIKTVQKIMDRAEQEKTSHFYFVFRDEELIGFLFLIEDEKKYPALPCLAISNADEQKMWICEELMRLQIEYFEELGRNDIASHTRKQLEEYRQGIGKRKEDDCR